MEIAFLLIVIASAYVLALFFGTPQLPRPSASGGMSDLPPIETVPKGLKLFGFKNVIVPDERGTTEIDVIFVGNPGIFVIELKEYNAWIFGAEDDEKWTARYIDGSSHQFQNPLRQNFRHVMALVGQLRLPKNRFHSVVAFSGDCELKTPMPTNVFVGDHEDYVRSMDGIRLTDTEVGKACDVLRALKSKSSRAALEQHVEHLHDRFSSATTCPKCGDALVERRSTKSTSDGRPFLGCRAYPKCTYTRKIDFS